MSCTAAGAHRPRSLISYTYLNSPLCRRVCSLAAVGVGLPEADEIGISATVPKRGATALRKLSVASTLTRALDEAADLYTASWQHAAALATLQLSHKIRRRVKPQSAVQPAEMALSAAALARSLSASLCLLALCLSLSLGACCCLMSRCLSFTACICAVPMDGRYDTRRPSLHCVQSSPCEPHSHRRPWLCCSSRRASPSLPLSLSVSLSLCLSVSLSLCLSVSLTLSLSVSLSLCLAGREPP